MEKHGMRYHPLYQTWSGIVNRCLNPKRPHFHNYGGRGIKVYEAWIASPTPFIEWIEANLGPRPDGHTLDRIDNDGHYEPGNLRWATPQQQALNTRSEPLHIKHQLPRGVDVVTSSSSFQVRIRIAGRSFYLGTYDTPEEASDVYEMATQERYFANVPFGAREMLFALQR